MLDIDAQFTFREVLDMTFCGHDFTIGTQKFLDRFDLRG